MPYKRHALDVVNRFKKMLESDVIETIGDEHFQELETLIAAALGVVDSKCRNEVASQLEQTLRQIKKDAAHVDHDYLIKTTLKEGEQRYTE